MARSWTHLWLVAALLSFTLFYTGCREPAPRQTLVAAGVRVIDISLHSSILGRDVPVRFVAPALLDDAPLAVIYVLHGAGETYRTWTEETHIAELARSHVLLVMPDGLDAYYINDATGFRYEDFFFQELMPAVAERFPSASRDRTKTAILGNSRGGYAAVVYALKHPDRFQTAVALSGAFDLADRPFRWHAPRESLAYRRVFGPPGSSTRADNDPFRLLTTSNPATLPYFDLTCTQGDVLLAPNQHLASALDGFRVPHEYHLAPGGHDWGSWNPLLRGVETRLLARLGFKRQDIPLALP